MPLPQAQPPPACSLSLPIQLRNSPNSTPPQPPNSSPSPKTLPPTNPRPARTRNTLPPRRKPPSRTSPKPDKSLSKTFSSVICRGETQRESQCPRLGLYEKSFVIPTNERDLQEGSKAHSEAKKQE